MNLKILIILVIIFLNLSLIKCKNCDRKKKPNIIIIMADDMGHNDVSYNGMNQFLTPNIDALGYNGIILNNYYVLPMCSPSRTALMTGKYPIRTGMQHFVIPNDEPWGLCPKEKIMPEIFRDAGYSTNLIGKWHLGFFKKSYTPTSRGFDNHYGYMGGYIDYWDQSLIMDHRSYSRGRDFYRNGVINFDGNGTYTTDLLTNEAVRVIENHNDETAKPLFLMVTHLAPHAGNDNDPYQAPQEEINKFNHITDPNRRIYAAMVSKLDEGIGKIIEALKKQNMLCNTIILFSSDNGAPTVGLHSNSGSNFPFKGQKNSPWEGAVRVPAIIYSPLLKRHNIISKQSIHISDILPTLAGASGIKLNSNLILDGINMWPYLNTGHIRNRKILNNIDDIFGYSSYLDGSWKYVNGTTGNGVFDLHLGEIGNERDPRSFNYPQAILQSKVQQVLKKPMKCSNIKQLNQQMIKKLRSETAINCPYLPIFEQNPTMKCKPLESPCLFQLNIDPCERYNFANIERHRLRHMENQIENFRQQAKEPVNQPSDPNSAPELHNFTWTWWQDETTVGMPGTYCPEMNL